MRRVLSFLNLVFTTLVLSFVALAIAPFDSGGRIAHRISCFWARIYAAVAGITVTLEGGDRVLSPPYILMCNHQSALDIHSLLVALPFEFKFVAKESLFRIPLFGWAMKRAGHISLDRDNPRKALKSMDEAARKIRGGLNIVIFPEGTRGVGGTLLPFKKGGFALALKAKVPVVPVGIVGTAALQPEGAHVPQRGGRVTIRMGEPIPVSGSGVAYKDELMREIRAKIEELLGSGPEADKSV